MKPELKTKIDNKLQEVVTEYKHTRKLVAATIVAAKLQHYSTFSANDVNKVMVKGWVDWIMEEL